MNTLVPPKAYPAFVQRAILSPIDIQRFADQQGIAPRIVVSRLQHEGHVDHPA